MADRYDLLTVREYERNGETKTSFTRVGVMFPSKNGDGFNIQLDALPVDGKLIARPPQQRGEQQQRRRDPWDD